MADVRQRGRCETARGYLGRRRRAAGRRGQGTLEYVTLVVVVIAALLAMQLYMKRGVQGKLRSSADDIGEQFSPTGYNGSFNINQNSASEETMHTIGQNAGASNSDATWTPLGGVNGMTSNRTGNETLADDYTNDKSFQNP